MRKGKNQHKISLVVSCGACIIYLLLLFTLFHLAVYADGNIILYLFNNFMLIFLIGVIFWILNKWIAWIVLEKCDFEAYRLYQEKAIKRKWCRNNAKMHLSLLNSYLILGRYDDSEKEIGELNRLYSKLSDLQKLELQLSYINQMIHLHGYSTIIAESQKAKEMLENLQKMNGGYREKVQKNIMIWEHLAKEEWEDVIHILEDIKKATVFEEINYAYILGTCYYELGEYARAFEEFRFISQWGGNTKYVTLANEMIETIIQKGTFIASPKNKPQNFKNFEQTILPILAVGCLVVALFVFVNQYSTYGNSYEEAYCRKHLSNVEDLTILYQEYIGDYEVVIFSKDDLISYCLFKEIPKASGTKYKILQSYHTGKYRDDRQTGLSKEELKLSEEEWEEVLKFYEESEITSEVWAVLTGFYKRKNVLNQDDSTCVGITFSPSIENVIINGKPVTVEQIITEDGDSAYIWKAEDLDLDMRLQIDYEN